MLVAGGRDNAGRFVQQVIDEIGSHTDRCAVDLDEIALDVDAPAENGDLTVHPHPTFLDEFLTRTARADASLCENFLQALAPGLAFGTGHAHSFMSLCPYNGAQTTMPAQRCPSTGDQALVSVAPFTNRSDSPRNRPARRRPSA